MVENRSARIDQLTKMNMTIQNQLSKLPKGKLISTANGSRTKWYVREDKQFTYLPKNKKALAEKLAMKKYLECRYEENLRELTILQEFSDFIELPRQSEVLLQDVRYAPLLQPYFKGKQEKVMLWENAEYIHNPYHPEELTKKTPAGYYVRSKSELLISMALTECHIPHRYEAQLDVAGHILYPDFTILHPRTMQVYYWEHFGRMDDPGYYPHAGKKIAEYINAGIIPDIHLIMTFETKEQSIDVAMIENKIQEFFS